MRQKARPDPRFAGLRLTSCQSHAVGSVAATHKFIDKLLPDDLIIFIPSSGINSNELHDLKSNCIIYLELNKNLNLGFVIDKTFLNAVALIGGNK